MDIKVLGAGCSKCKLLTKRLEALQVTHNLSMEIEKVTQLDDIMSYGVMMTPGLVISGEVKSVGKVPSDSQLLEWIRAAE